MPNEEKDGEGNSVALAPVDEEAGEDEALAEDPGRHDAQAQDNGTANQEPEQDKTEKARLCQRIVEKGLK